MNDFLIKVRWLFHGARASKRYSRTPPPPRALSSTSRHRALLHAQACRLCVRTHVRTPIMRNAASGSRTKQRREKKRHEGRGVAGRLPVESDTAGSRHRSGRVWVERPHVTFRVTLTTAAGNSAIFSFSLAQPNRDRSTRN